MANLSTACKVFLDQEFLEVQKQSMEIKKATAQHLFLDSLQDYIRDANDYVVRCGCKRCTDMIGGNYPELGHEDEGNRGTGRPGSPNYWVSCYGEMKEVDARDCVLYKWFKSKCEEFKVPVPDDDIDHPWRYPRMFNLMTCLGRGLIKSSISSDEVTKRWRARVKALSYPQQVATVYPMIYSIYCDGTAYDEVDSFQDWFVVKGVSLLP